MVRIHVWTPSAGSLSKEEREMMEALRESAAFKPKPETEQDKRSFFSKFKDVFG